MRWLDAIIDSMDRRSLSKFQETEGEGSLVCCSPWGCKELDTTEQLNNNLRTGVWFGQAFSVFVWAFLIAVMAVATCHGAGGCAI